MEHSEGMANPAPDVRRQMERDSGQTAEPGRGHGEELGLRLEGNREPWEAFDREGP